MYLRGLGRYMYISVSVHRDIFSDDLRIDTRTQISILQFKKKNQNHKNIQCITCMFTTESESNSMVKK
jgi:hypothetical protein